MLPAEARDRIRAIAAARGPLLVVSDLDGTLAPIVEDPGNARVPDAAIEVLDRLATVCRVTILTGRDLNTARRMVPHDDITIIGSHGLEPSFDSPLLPGVDRNRLAPALELAEQHVLSAVPAAYLHIERKSISTAFHFRTAPHLEAPLRLALADLPEGLRIREGRMVLEVMPDAQGGKGLALTAVVRHFKAHAIVTLGDDLTDVAMFRAALVERDSGEEVLICGVDSGEETPADIRALSDLLLSSPEAAREVLEELASALGV